MTPKNRTTLNSFLKRPSLNQFVAPPNKSHIELNNDQINILLGCLSASSVKAVLQNHYFTLGGKIYKQSDGGSIGLDMTVELAAIYMLMWDLAYLTKLKNMGIKISLYSRYVDDIVLVCREFEPGWYFGLKEGKLLYNPGHEYSNLQADQRTMYVLRDIANQMDSDIQLTIDTPSLHSNGRLPVLDLEVFLIQNKIHFSFYKKPMSNPQVIQYTSAISNRIKRDSLLQEGLRRIRNCSSGVTEGEKTRILSSYMNTLRISGYLAPYRFQILKGVLNRQQQIEEEIARGDRVRFRNRLQIVTQKQQTVGNYPNTWFLKADTTNILKIPCTPQSKLVNLVREKSGNTRGPDGGLTKFVEMGGLPISLMFPNKDQFGGNLGCQYGVKCYIAENQDCRIARAVYRVECETCQNLDGSQYIYIGTTGFNIHKRMLEHKSSVRQGHVSNALAKHMALYHPGQEASFVTKCLSGGIKYNLERFILEALEIEEARQSQDVRVMNSRSEWGGKGLPRIQVSQS